MLVGEAQPAAWPDNSAFSTFVDKTLVLYIYTDLLFHAVSILLRSYYTFVERFTTYNYLIFLHCYYRY